MLPTQLKDGQAKASDQAYARLRQMIVSLKLEPGSFIDEKSISQQLGIGRTPVREALLRLANQRLVEILPRKGTVVTPIRFQDLRAVEELRWHLETLGARWAAERIEPEELRDLKTLISNAESGAFADVEDWDVEVDRAFHAQLAAAAKNVFLVENLTRLFDHSVRLMYATRTSIAAAMEEISEYRAILEAIEAGSPQDAADAMRHHLLSSREQIARDLGISLSSESRTEDLVTLPR